MRKKILSLFLITIFLGINNTQSITFYDSLSGIAVIPSDHFEYGEENPFTGHLDLLINPNDYPSDSIQTEVNQTFKDHYPNYNSITHINHTDWMSYLAFYKDASFELYDEYEGIHIFANENNQHEQINRVKVVYFDEDGNTIFISDVHEILHPKWYESGRGVIFVDVEQQTTTSTYETNISIFIVLAFMFSLVFAAFLTFIKLLLAIICKVKIVNYPRVFVINYIIYIVLFSTMIPLFLTVNWEGNLFLSTLKGIAFVSGFIITEAIIFSSFFRKHEKIFKFTGVYTSVYFVITIVIGALSLLL